jgi:hypothetical protein
MSPIRTTRVHRAAASLALALFLTGTNYCLVGTIAVAFGARVSCMAPAGAASTSCHASAGASHCAHSQTPSKQQAPVRTGTPPCCVALAPVLATHGLKIVTGDLAVAVQVAPATDAPASALADWHGHRVSCDAGPPSLHARAPLSSRAPPLA